jgi:hypothetical protein
MTDPVQTEREAGWVRLSDSEWVNIVNHPEVLGHGSDSDLAVACAVRLTEAKLRELNVPELRSLRDALALAKADVERYRWLREVMGTADMEKQGAAIAALNAVDSEPTTPDQFDAAIDAARAALKEKGE